MKSTVLILIVVLAAIASGCLEWSEDQQGNLRSVGAPGIPIWQSSKPAAPLSPSDLGIPPEEAAKFGGPVLVMPAASPSQAYHYRYYEAGQNHCQEDLEKLLELRAREQAAGPPPYCTDKPTAPENHGSGMIL